MLYPDIPALILAPMDGLSDAPMRAVQSELGAFTFAVSEFIRVSSTIPPRRQFHRHIPELLTGAVAPGGLPVQVQLLGGDPGRMGEAAAVACAAGARAIDINFGCPAPTVNRHDGGAALLKHPERIRAIVAAVRAATPQPVPVSAKLRLGWDSMDAIYANADMAAEGGASWLTIHGRTRVQGYTPPAHWGPIGRVRERLGIPVVANGDIWTVEDYRLCREETGCIHFMLGRGAIANPLLPLLIAARMGLPSAGTAPTLSASSPDWVPLLQRLVFWTEHFNGSVTFQTTSRLKQWLKIASLHGGFRGFDDVKHAQTSDELFAVLRARGQVAA